MICYTIAYPKDFGIKQPEASLPLYEKKQALNEYQNMKDYSDALQTFDPENDVLRFATSYDYEGFYQNEISLHASQRQYAGGSGKIQSPIKQETVRTSRFILKKNSSIIP